MDRKALCELAGALEMRQTVGTAALAITVIRGNRVSPSPPCSPGIWTKNRPCGPMVLVPTHTHTGHAICTDCQLISLPPCTLSSWGEAPCLLPPELNKGLAMQKLTQEKQERRMNAPVLQEEESGGLQGHCGV